MPRAPKKCGDLDCTTRVPGGVTYCPEHEKRSPSSIAADDPAERRRRKAAVEAHVAIHGWWCPGWGSQEAHESHDLTAAHTKAVGLGGADSELRVLCRTCNSSQLMAGFSLPDMGSPLR